MEYDNYGNIKTKNGIAYTYDNTWKDLLLQVGTGDNSTISYDDQGNPLTYLGHTLTWEKGRQLKKFVKSDGTVIDYTYNANGIRTSKKVNGVLHTYTLDGTKILRETWGDNTLIPLYDNEDSVCGIIHNDIPYYFIKNLQGDIIALVDKDAKTVARYSYDAWGAVTSAITYTDLTEDVDIAAINPFRYRGYYYDEEIGLYYLQSRYYDAQVGRFVNCDSPEMIGLSTISDCVKNSNLSIYCLNNPTNDSDVVGCISANQIANMFSINTLFALFMPILYASYSKGLVAVGAYATKVVTPVAAKAFWWKPWLAAAIIVAAVAIIVASVAIMYAKREKEIEEAKRQIPNKLMKGNKVDLSKFGTRLPNGQGWKGPDDWKIVKDLARHATKKWKLYKAKKRIASLLEDGTIYGK